MEKENELEQLEEVPEPTEVTEGEEDKTDWKAEALKYQGIAKRNSTRATKYKTLYDQHKVEPPAQNNGSKPPAEKKSFDYGEKAFLISNQIPIEEHEFVLEQIHTTGKSLDDLLGAKWFQAELKERRDAKVVREALPTGSKRSDNSSRDQVDYWIDKGQLPPDPVLRIKVVNEKIKRAKAGSQFTDTPVVR